MREFFLLMFSLISNRIFPVHVSNRNHCHFAKYKHCLNFLFVIFEDSNASEMTLSANDLQLFNIEAVS
jgi:hypothetical protein